MHQVRTEQVALGIISFSQPIVFGTLKVVLNNRSARSQKLHKLSHANSRTFICQCATVHFNVLIIAVLILSDIISGQE